MLQHMIQVWVQRAVDELLKSIAILTTGSPLSGPQWSDPTLIRHGDYATSATMQLTGLLRKPPSVIA